MGTSKQTGNCSLTDEAAGPNGYQSNLSRYRSTGLATTAGMSAPCTWHYEEVMLVLVIVRSVNVVSFSRLYGGKRNTRRCNEDFQRSPPPKGSTLPRSRIAYEVSAVCRAAHAWCTLERSYRSYLAARSSLPNEGGSAPGVGPPGARG
jgi:hypothetical protein